MGSSLVLNRRPKVPAEDTAAFGAIAERFRRAGALEQAVSLCRDGLKKFPDHVSARVTLGWSLLDLGKYGEARVELEQVMRRAPDNLAAIRGLAELHDRFEHTLNLPMDGPGQWPPPAESVEGEAGQENVSTVDAKGADNFEQFEAEVPEQSGGFAEPAMAPAAMGLPLWTPEPAAAPVVETASASATTAATTTTATAATSVTATAAPTATTTTAAGSGMSSVREIDAFAGAPVPNVAAHAVAAPESAAQQPQSVPQPEAGLQTYEYEKEAEQSDVSPDSLSEDAIAALILESASLDESALLDESASLDAAAALDVEVAPDALELGAVDFALDTAATVELEPAGPMELELAAVEPMAAVVEPVVELADEIEAPAEPAIEIDAVAEPPVEVVVEAAVEPLVASAPEPAAEIDIEEVEIESVPEPEFARGVAAQVAEVIEFAARPTPVIEQIDLEPMALLRDEMALLHDEDAQEDSFVDAVATSKSAATVVALERMLRRVQARRRELMAESVA